MKLIKSKGLQILEKVAAQNGVSVDEVRAEIEVAIDIGMASPDLAVQAKWKSLCKDGKKPTPEQAIIMLSKEIK